MTIVRKWIDYSFARPGLAEAVKDGAAGAFRYICPDLPNTHGKILTAAERDAILHAGLDLVLNFEWYATRCLEGHAAGLEDGKTALAMARALGYPAGAAIYFSVDTDTHNYAAIDAYFAAVWSVLAGHYAVGAYGSYDVVAHLLAKGLAKFGWQTLAWSNGKRDPGAVVYQDGASWFHGSADEDLVTGPVGSWKQTAPTPTPPKPPTPTPTPKPGPTPPPKPKPKPTPTPKPNRVVVVHSGDTLTSIAARFHTTVARLAALNHLSNPSLIFVGETIYVDQAAPPKPPVINGRKYEVVAGDTLSSIAARFHVAGGWQQLARLNRISNPDLVRAGQVITL